MDEHRKAVIGIVSNVLDISMNRVRNDMSLEGSCWFKVRCILIEKFVPVHGWDGITVKELVEQMRDSVSKDRMLGDFPHG